MYNIVPAVVKNPGAFLSITNTINSARERGSQKSLLSCTHAYTRTKLLCHICVDCPILSRLILQITEQLKIEISDPLEEISDLL
jgi:hypothetical protein